MQNEIDIQIKKTTLPITAVTTVTAETSIGEIEKKDFLDISANEEIKLKKHYEGKPRWSKKFKCPRCKHHPLEIYNFLDSTGKKVCDVYVCHKHNDTPSFFTKEECGII